MNDVSMFKTDVSLFFFHSCLFFSDVADKEENE